MADHVVVIKLQLDLQLENLGLKKIPSEEAISSGGTGASSVGSGGADRPQSPAAKLSTEELNSQFIELSSTIRSLASSINQVNSLVSQVGQGKLPTSAAPILNPNVASNAGSTPAVASLPAQEAAAKAAEVADEAAAQALKEQAESAARAAKSSGSIASILEELHKASVDVTKSATSAAAATNNVGKAFGDLSQRMGGRLSSAGLFSKVFAPIAQDSGFKSKAAGVRSPEDFFRIDPGLSDAARSQAEELQKTLVASINRAVKSLDTSDLTTNTGKIFADTIGFIISDIREAERVGVKGLKFATKEFSEAFKAREFIVLADQAAVAAKKFEEARNAGSDLRTFIEDFDLAIAKLTRLTSKELGQTRRETLNVGPGRDLAQIAGQEIPRAASGLDLSKFQQSLVNMARSSIQVAQPLEVVRNLFTRLAGDLDNLEDNVRLVRKELQETQSFEVGGAENFQRLRELLNLFNIRRTNTGVIRAPQTVAPEASAIFNTGELNRLRQSLSGSARGAELSKTLNFTDAAGNVKKIQVELRQLGNTIDTVQVKAKNLSENMFDRANVRTALQRVATWGAAAGLVFGAISVFKDAADTVVKTESSIVTLGKVLDEAQVNFEQFKKTATSTAISIAQEFGQPLEDVIDTMITFAQQGKTLSETISLTKASALAANVTTLDQPTAASALTAVTEQFNIPVQDATSIVDKFNNVANNAAVTETQLAEALKKAGNSAVNAGVDLDQFNGAVAAIAEQTRQAGAEIGNALKFIFQRVNTKEAEEGLARVGVSVRDASGNLRPFIDIVRDLRLNFDNLTEAQKNQVAVAVAGGHRFNTFLALLQNFERFEEATANSVNSAGSALREQERVAETSAFKIQQLKNSAAGAAVSFGSIFLPAIKGVTDVLRSLFDALSNIPDAVKLIGTSGAASLILFSRFADKATAFIDLFDRSGSGGQGVFGAVGGFLAGRGQGQDITAQTDPALFTRLGGADSALNLSRQVQDFSGFGKSAAAAKSFTDELKKGNLVLVDTSGNIVKNTQGMTKFAAVSRGLSAARLDEFNKVIDRTSLGLLALNTGFSRLIAGTVKISDGLLRLTGVGQAIGAIEKRFSGASAASVTLAANIFRVAGAVAAIALLVEAFQTVSEIVNENGETIKKNLREEVAAREEALNKIRKQREELKALSQEGIRSAGIQAVQDLEPEPLRNERIRRGSFIDPELERRRLAERETTVTNQIAFANPQLIRGVDQFGNAVLRSVSAFDQLADSAVSAQARILALTKINVAEGFIKDLDPAGGAKKFFGNIARDFDSLIETLSFDILDPFDDDIGKTVGDKFREELGELQSLLADPKIKEAAKLGVSVEFLDKDFSEQLDKQAQRLEKSSLAFREVFEKIRSELKGAPEDTGELFLRNENVRRFAGLEAQRITAESRTPTSGQEVLQQLFLQNRSSFKGVQGLIGLNARETEGRFNERGVLAQTIDLRDNIEGSLNRLRGGELVLIDSLLGTPQQFETKLNEFGDVVVRTINDATGRIEEVSLADLIRQGNIDQIKFFDPKIIQEQFDVSVLELERVISGAARGSLLGKDLDLGSRRRFDVSGQQLASFRDETLIKDVLDARRGVETFLEGFRASSEDTAAPISLGKLKEFQQLQIRQDTLDSILRFSAEIEDLGKAFDKALDDIQAQRLGDAIKAQFSGVLGAGRGAVEDRTNRPLLESELNAEQIFSRAANPLIEAANTLSQTEKALGENVAARENFNREGIIQLRDLLSSTAAGGIRDPNEATQLSSRILERTQAGVSSAENILIELNNKQVNLQQESVNVLNQILNAIGSQDPARASSSIEAAVQRIERGVPGGREILSSRVEALSSEQLSKLRDPAIFGSAKVLGDQSPQALIDEAVQRTSEKAIGRLSTQLLNIGTSPAPKSTELTEAEKVADKLLNSGGDSQAIKSIAESMGEEVKQAVSRRLLDRAIREDAPQQKNIFQQLLSDVARTRLQSGNSSIEVSDEDARGFGKALAEAQLRDGSPGAKAAGERLQSGLDSGNQEIINALKEAIQRASQLPIGRDVPPLEEQAERSAQQEFDRIKQLNQDFIDASKATQEFIRPLLETAASLKILKDSVSDVAVGIRESIKSSLDTISSSRILGSLGASTQSGVLAGVVGAEFDSGRGRSSLGGQELTELENQGLIKTGNEIQSVFAAARDALDKASDGERRLIEARREAADRQDFTAVAELDNGLEQIGNAMGLLRLQAENAAEGLSGLGDSIRTLNSVNQLRADVENLFRSFKQQRATLFDRTSIDTALGRTPFSFTRPTFEQFERGQGGRLTKFERAIEDVDFQQRTGQLTGQEASRQKNKAEFERDEDIIGLAQQKENKSFELQISQAEQLRERLLAFSVGGTSGASVAAGLADKLRSELEQAGDILPSDIAGRTVRDPRTGQNVQVPSSQVLEFRGVRGLSDIERQVNSLAAQVKEEEQQKQATLTSDPIVTALKDTSTNIIQKLDELISVSASNPTVKSGEAVQRQISIIQGSGAAQRLASGGGKLDRETVDLQEVSRLRGDLDRARELSPETLNRALETTQVKFEGVNSSLSDFIEKLSISAESEKVRSQLQKLAEDIGLIVDQASSLSDAFRQLTERFSLFIPADGVQKKASGGLVTGPGGPREDKVPLLASAGEFVINAQSVKSLGLPLLNKLNRGGSSISRSSFSGNLPGFKDGGLVGLTPEEELELLRLAQRGRPVLQDGEVKSQGQLEDERIKKLREDLKNSPTFEEIKNLQEKRSKRVDNLERRGSGIRLSDPLLFQSGFSVTFDQRGKPTFTNAPGVGIKLNSNLENLDLSSESAFRKESSEKRGLETAETVRKRKESQLKAEEELQADRALNKFNQLKTEGFIQKNAALVQRKLEENKRQFLQRIEPTDREVQQIFDLAQTESGRNILLGEESENGLISKKAGVLGLELIENANILDKLDVKPISITDPVTGRKIEVGFGAFGPNSGVSKEGEVFGKYAFAADAFPGIAGAGLRQRAAALKTLAEQVQSSFDFGSSSFAIQDLPPGIAEVAAISAGVGKSVRDLGLGTAKLAGGLAVGAADVAGDVFTGDFGGAANTLGRGGKTLAKGIVSSLLEPLKVAGNLGGFAINRATGNKQEAFEDLEKAAGGTFGVLSGVALAGPTNALVKSGFRAARSGVRAVSSRAAKVLEPVSAKVSDLRARGTNVLNDIAAKIEERSLLRKLNDEMEQKARVEEAAKVVEASKAEAKVIPDEVQTVDQVLPAPGSSDSIFRSIKRKALLGGASAAVASGIGAPALGLAALVGPFTPDILRLLSRGSRVVPGAKGAASGIVGRVRDRIGAARGPSQLEFPFARGVEAASTRTSSLDEIARASSLTPSRQLELPLGRLSAGAFNQSVRGGTALPKQSLLSRLAPRKVQEILQELALSRELSGPGIFRTGGSNRPAISRNAPAADLTTPIQTPIQALAGDILRRRAQGPVASQVGLPTPGRAREVLFGNQQNLFAPGSSIRTVLDSLNREVFGDRTVTGEFNATKKAPRPGQFQKQTFGRAFLDRKFRRKVEVFEKKRQSDKAEEIIRQRGQTLPTESGLDLPTVESQRILNSLIEMQTGVPRFVQQMRGVGTPVKPETLNRIAVTRRVPASLLDEARRLTLGREDFVESRIGHREIDSKVDLEDQIDISNPSVRVGFHKATLAKIQQDLVNKNNPPDPASKMALKDVFGRFKDLEERGIFSPDIQQVLSASSKQIDTPVPSASKLGVEARTVKAKVGAASPDLARTRPLTPTVPPLPATAKLVTNPPSISGPRKAVELLKESIGGPPTSTFKPLELDFLKNILGLREKSFKPVQSVANPELRKTFNLKESPKELMVNLPARPPTGPVNQRPGFVAPVQRSAPPQTSGPVDMRDAFEQPSRLPVKSANSLDDLNTVIKRGEVLPPGKRQFGPGRELPNIAPVVKRKPSNLAEIEKFLADKQAGQSAPPTKVEELVQALSEKADPKPRSPRAPRLPKKKKSADDLRILDVRDERGLKEAEVQEFLRKRDQGLPLSKRNIPKNVGELEKQKLSKEESQLIEDTTLDRTKTSGFIGSIKKLLTTELNLRPAFAEVEVPFSGKIFKPKKKLKGSESGEARSELVNPKIDTAALRPDVPEMTQPAPNIPPFISTETAAKNVPDGTVLGVGLERLGGRASRNNVLERVRRQPSASVLTVGVNRIGTAAENKLFDTGRGLGGSSAGEFDVKPFHKGRFQKRTFGGVFLDRKFRQQLAKLQVSEPAASKVIDDLEIEELSKLADLFGIKDKFASGGKISGPGGPRSDKVPILASSGEFVMNAAAVDRVGLPVMEFINKTGSIPFGALQKFKDGGLVGGRSSSGSTDTSTSVEVRIDTQGISEAITTAINDAFSSASVPLDTIRAGQDLSAALSDSISRIRIPDVKVDTTNVSIPVDVPNEGVSINVDTIALETAVRNAFRGITLPKIEVDTNSLKGIDLGGNLGAAVRNRLEAVEGSVASLREDANDLLSSMEKVDPEIDKLSRDLSTTKQAVTSSQDRLEDVEKTVSALKSSTDAIKSDTAVVKIEVANLGQLVANQKQDILNTVFTLLNEQISNLQLDSALTSRLDKHIATTQSSMQSIGSRINEAMDIANRALSQALARI